MKKDILKVFLAITFIILALITGAYLNNLQDNAEKQVQQNKNIEAEQIYENNLNNKSFNLPVLLIDTSGQQLSREEEITANLQLYNNQSSINTLNDKPEVISKVNIKIRGNSSSHYPKKQFSIELINDKGKEKNISLLGMPKESEWVLNGPFLDKSLMRNYIALNTASKIMEYAPRVKFCEVIMVEDNEKELNEDNYRGIYILVEKIKRDEERVDITKTLENKNETSFILAKDRQKEQDYSITSYGKETDQYYYGLNIVYPKKDLTPAKYDYIMDEINKFERILYSDKFNDPIEGYSKYIDVDTFVDYYIINEFFKNTDAGTLSTYIYKDYEEKIKAGPIWDFNESLGNSQNEYGDIYEYRGFTMIDKSWFDRLMMDINFVNKVVERYKELRKTYLSDEYLLNFIDETVEFLGDSTKRNFERWPIYISNQARVFEDLGSMIDNFSDLDSCIKLLEENDHLLKNTDKMATSYEEEINLMKNFIVNRGKWMDSNIDSLKKWANK